MKRFARKRERERDWRLEKKTFLEPWINTAVVKSEEYADERREGERERERVGSLSFLNLNTRV